MTDYHYTDSTQEGKMVAFLAIIGLGIILWWLSKVLIRMGNVLEKIGDNLAVRSVTPKAGGHKKVSDVETVREQVHVAKGEGTDKEYWDNVQKEINDLTE
jgi:hypothetical protein